MKTESILSRLSGRHFTERLENTYEFANALLPFSDLFCFIFRFETISVFNGKISPLPVQPKSGIGNGVDTFLSVEELPDAELRELFISCNASYACAISLDGLFYFGCNEAIYNELKEADVFNSFFFQLRATYLSIAAHRQLETVNLAHKILTDVQLKITSSLDKNDIFNAILDGLQTLVGYDAAGIFVDIEDQAGVEQVIARGYSESKLSLFREKKIHGVTATIYDEKKPVIIGDVSSDPRYFNAREETKSQLSVPMFVGENVIGVFTLEKDHPHFYSEQNIPILTTLSEQAVIALANAKLYQDSLQKQRLEKDMIDAAAIQSTLLIKRAPRLQGADISLLYRANRYVGGDIYDIIKRDNTSFYFNIGDVSGKGAPAALLMAVLFAGLRSQLSARYQICEHVAHLNNLLSRSTKASSYATYFLATYNSESSELTYTNAGHTPPILLRQNGDVEYLNVGGMVIGFLENQTYHQASVHIASGDVLVAFTDGLDEAFDADENEFGIKRITETIKIHREKSAAQIKQELLAAVEDFHGAELDDDLTIIVTKFTDET